MSEPNNREVAPEAIIKVLIIYWDFASAAQANATLIGLKPPSDVRMQWIMRPWRTDMLKFPPTAEEAMTDANDAHLIVFAGLQTRPLPFWLLLWLERWAAARQVKDAALAVIGCKDVNKSASELAHFASSNGLSCFIKESLVDQPASANSRLYPNLPG